MFKYGPVPVGHVEVFMLVQVCKLMGATWFRARILLSSRAASYHCASSLPITYSTPRLRQHAICAALQHKMAAADRPRLAAFNTGNDWNYHIAL